MSAKQRKKPGRTTAPSARHRPAAGTFQMVVAANPGAELSVAPELDLVKAALLYGERVTLLSPITTMFLRIEGLQRFSARQQIQLIRRLAPVLTDADQHSQLEQGLGELDDFLRRSARSRSLGDQILRAGLLKQFEPMQQLIADAVRDMRTQIGIDQLAAARAKGLVQIENADPGDELDLLVSSVTAAKLAETGQRRDDPHTNRIADDFVGKLSKHLSSGREYLIFDESIANLTEAAIREGLFTPAKGPAGRSAQAMTASALMGRLPTFPSATVDEILDIRSELAPALAQFRGAMVTVASSFTIAPWESNFEDEVHDAWVGTVLPAVEAIDSSIRENRSILLLATGVAGAINTSLPGLAIVAAGLLGHAGAATALGGAISGGVPLLQALRDRRAATLTVRMQPFYFLYATERGLA